MKEKDIKELRINEIISELETCREDERSSQEQVIQIIVTAGTVLGIIFAISNFEMYSNTEQYGYLLRALLALNDLVFCAAFSYATSMGITNVLRYHYIRHLEDRLSVLISQKGKESKFMHWMSFSSPVTTRNLRHVKSKYSRASYFFYTMTVVFIICFCIYITVMQYINLGEHNKTDILLVVIPGVFIVVPLIVYMVVTSNPEKMYQFAMKESMKKRKERINRKKVDNENNKKKKIEIKEIVPVINYFIYPKKQDLQKTVLLLISFFMGIFLLQGNFNITLTKGQVHNLCILILVVDVLIYQARYQWNDIRGLAEDVAAGKTNRLPVHIMGEQNAVRTSTIILILKIAIAMIIIELWGGNISLPLLVCCGLIAISAIAYETVRSKKIVWAIFVLVSVGYPLRLFAGMWAAWPQMWKELQIRGILKPHFAIVILLVAYGFFGLYSVVLSWTQEVIYQKKRNLPITKSHYEFLLKLVENKYGAVIFIRNKNDHPLKKSGKIWDLWNWTYIVSMVLLSGTFMFFDISIYFWIFEIEIILISLALCCVDKVKIILLATLSFILIVTKSILLILFSEGYVFGVIIGVSQLMFMGIYLFLRFGFDPNFDFINFCKSILDKFVMVLIGRQTWELLNSKKKS